ncbi:DNA-binding transcriptional activator GutM [Planococcus massiliensis]|uniref:DNA-binding transcriptional activator GutM n=1 Tax=Planococcus massiliensis TaxID=1499687 RepID=A0A098EJR6_9BACL|nr:transcriptional regulator GutM [Planococcus massiliensis]CEG22543.1 DNA-binding transcriptional activator GutM [Planococcus massiliensis]
MWGWFIAVFAGVWLLQIMMTKIQMKNYQLTIKKMSKRPSGYLGVGIQKQKLGIGVIAVIVVNNDGMVLESQLMKGVTVFSRFEPYTVYDGLHIEEVKKKTGGESVDQAVKMAIEKIESQMEKKAIVAV